MTTDPTIAWQQLVATALVGTQRRPLPVLSAPGVHDVLANVGTDEQAVLRAAAVLGAYRRAGVASRQLDPAAASDDDQPTEDRSECSAHAAQLLELVLTGAAWTKEGKDLLVREWCNGCDRTSQRVPYRLITALLTATSTARPDAAARVIGERGRWLAAHNDRWAWAVTEETTAETSTETIDVHGFETAAPVDRVPLLRRLRQHDPERARDLLHETWARESAADRTAFIEVLADGLSLADEPFLEAALRDRAKGVRSRAADLLARLAGSAYGERMAQRIRPLVTTSGVLRKRIDVALPDALDDTAEIDGIDPKPPTGVGERAWWLRQMIGGAPLDRWTDWCGVAPADIISRASESETSVDLAIGWMTAAVRQHNADWAEALYDAKVANGGQVDLIAQMRPAALEARAERALRSPKLEVHVAVPVLVACTTPWRASLAEAVLAGVAATPALFVPVEMLAAGLPPSAEPALAALVASLPDDSRRRQLRNLSQIMSIRSSIAQEFS